MYIKKSLLTYLKALSLRGFENEQGSLGLKFRVPQLSLGLNTPMVTFNSFTDWEMSKRTGFTATM